jgi:hypothetical protein
LSEELSLPSSIFKGRFEVNPEPPSFIFKVRGAGRQVWYIWSVEEADFCF